MINISGVLIKTYPKNLTEIKTLLGDFQGVEVHGNNDDGGIVITLDQESTNKASDTLVAIQKLPGVLSASMIYHQFED